jgi:hypothetical protein
MPYINEPRGGIRRIKRGRAPRQTSVLSMMGFGDCVAPQVYSPTTGACMSAGSATGIQQDAWTIPTSTASAEPSVLEKLLGGATTAIVSLLTPKPAPNVVVMQAPGMSTTTKIALAGGALLALALIARR